MTVLRREVGTYNIVDLDPLSFVELCKIVS